ncbi:TPA: MFS transporter [Candidatus Bathyarchaeota archaeon]|nr:MFS transporter [Candidatus Bathyarchaeota archaeon]
MEKPNLKQFTSIMTFGLFTMVLTHTLTHTFQNIHTTLFPVLKQEFNLGYYELGLIAAIPPLCQAILSIPAGMLSDKLGTKKMILFSQLLSCAGSLIAGFTMNPWMLIAAVSLLYLNTTFYHPPSYSYVTKTSKPQDRSKALGILGAGGTLGMAIGPLSISFLMGYLAFQWRQVYLFWFFPILIGTFMILKLRSEPSQPTSTKAKEGIPSSEAKTVVTRSMLFFIMFNAVKTLGTVMVSGFLMLYLVQSKGWSVGDAALLISGASMMGVIAAPLGGFFADKVGEKKWTVLTTTAGAISFGVAFLVPWGFAFTAFYLGYGFFNLLSMASNSSLTAKLSPSRQRGLGFALYFLPGSIMGVLAPMVSAFIASNYGLPPVFFTATAVLLLCVPVLQFGVKVD